MSVSHDTSRALAAYGELAQVACPLCRSYSDELYVWAESHYGPEKFRVTRCRTCSMIYTNPQPLTYTTEVAERGVLDRHFSEGKIARHRRMASLVLSVLARYGQGRRVLDFGCGEGAFVAQARSEGWDAMGTDLNRGLVTRANTFWRFDALYPGSLEEFLAVTREPFDAVVTSQVFEHLQDPIHMGRQLRRLLKPRGLLYIDVPNAYQLKEWVKPGTTLDPTAHWNHFTLPTLRRLMSEMGFHVEMASGAPSLVNVYHRLRLGRFANTLGRLSRQLLPSIGSGVSCLGRRTLDCLAIATTLAWA